MIIYFVYEIDAHRTYDRACIKLAESSLGRANKFYEEYKDNYIGDDWIWVLASYDVADAEPTDGFNLLKDLIVIKDTEGEY